MSKSPTRLNTRSFVTLVIAFSALGLPLTGLANHLYGFAPLTVARHAWMSAHNSLGVLFTIFAIWHIALNRRPLWNYLKGTAARIPKIGREALLAGALVGIVLLLFVGHAFLLQDRSKQDLKTYRHHSRGAALTCPAVQTPS